MSIRSVIFDLDNTLVDRDAALRRWLSTQLEPSEVEEALSIDRGAKGEISPLCRWLAERKPALGPVERLVAGFSTFVAAEVEPDPEVAEFLRRLAKRRSLGLVTNGDPAAQRAKLDRAGLGDCFRAVVLADELGTPKPNPAAFRAVIDELGHRPEQCLFVGDDPARDIAGAHALGMRTCWVGRGRVYPEGLPRPDVIVGELYELEALS